MTEQLQIKRADTGPFRGRDGVIRLSTNVISPAGVSLTSPKPA